MDSKLFAFQVARPIEFAVDELVEYSYDPSTQTSVWGGDGRPVAALHCTRVSYGRSCNAYGSYCTTYGSYHNNGLTCDG
jgi:hypothetical protein